MIYHENEQLDNLRVKIDEALSAYLIALGLDANDLTDLDYSEVDEAIENLTTPKPVYQAPFMVGLEESLDKLTIRKVNDNE